MEDEANKQEQQFEEEEYGEIPVNDELELDDDLYKSFSHGVREFHILDELDATAVEEECEEGNKEMVKVTTVATRIVMVNLTWKKMKLMPC